MSENIDTQLQDHLSYLKLSHLHQHWEELLSENLRKGHDTAQTLRHLLSAEVREKRSRSITRRIKLAQFPVIKTLEQYDFTWPQEINQDQIRHLFGLSFMKQAANIIYIGNTGVGKSHLAIALGHQACQKHKRVLHTNTLEMINRLEEARRKARLNQELKRYVNIDLLALDEFGYLPIDQSGADHLFQVISRRYERGSTIITTNKAYRDWPATLNNDSALTSALLDRLLHRSETILIKGKSYRMKDRID
jgi:DNA replication protein DnaC